MGQQASTPSTPSGEKNADWCRDTSDAPQPDRATDSVRIGKLREAPGLCGGKLPEGPEVLVSDVTTTSATLHWSPKDVRKVHIEILLRQGGVETEVAFFEVGGSEASLELPGGTLARGQGPYQAQLVLESGPVDQPKLTAPSVSLPFWALSEPPAAVVGLTLAEVLPDSFTVEWNAPEDDGGQPIEAYEVQLLHSSKEEAVPAERTEVELAQDKGHLIVLCSTTRQRFAGLQPGSGPHHVQVRARNGARRLGPEQTLQVYTSCLAPAPPTQLRARLLPGWARSQVCGVLHSEGADPDVDVVKLEFLAPVEDGGRPIQSYFIHAEEECQDPGEKPDATPALRSLEVPASSVTWSADVASSACSCHVAVEPNRSYTFTVEACNGQRRTLSAPCAPVFAPARVPRPPEAPQVAAQGTLAAELRWSACPFGGGLPLEAFKIGVVLADDPGLENLQKEVTLSIFAVAEKAFDADKVHEEVPCKARVDGLQPSRRYSFLLAASNAAGTGRWSAHSTVLETPSAPPNPPVNTVATVSQDAEQQVVVSVSWDCGPEIAGSGALAAFDVQLLPSELQQVRPSSDRRLVRERVAAQNARPGQRIRWAKTLASPGTFVIEVAAENGMGQRSLPAVLSLEVRPEAFPPSLELPSPPKWSEEPLLVLGPAADTAQRFGSLEGTWLQTLLLWDTQAQPSGPAGTMASSVDVLCFFRRPGSGQVFRAVLASQVTTSRLQVALPAHIPMSLRLSVNLDPRAAARVQRPPMSEPLAVLFSDEGETLRPSWEIWSRQTPDGQPPRWTSLPQELHQCIEAAWLEGHPKVALQLPHATEGRMDSYELTFGDERQTQSSVKKLGPGGWVAKARRSVLESETEDPAAPSAPVDELCVICMERRRTHAFMHADTGDGHLAVCVDCAEAYRAEATVPGAHRAVRSCPMCRRSFSALQRIYQ